MTQRRGADFKTSGYRTVGPLSNNSGTADHYRRKVNVKPTPESLRSETVGLDALKAAPALQPVCTQVGRTAAAVTMKVDQLLSAAVAHASPDAIIEDGQFARHVRSLRFLENISKIRYPDFGDLDTALTEGYAPLSGPGQALHEPVEPPAFGPYPPTPSDYPAFSLGGEGRTPWESILNDFLALEQPPDTGSNTPQQHYNHKGER